MALLLCMVLPVTAMAQTAADGTSAPQDMLRALNRAAAAVVGVDVKVAEGARSAASLGAQRTGSGVVIADDGLVLTIGYLLLEADSVTLQIGPGRSVPARVVAYDVDTGFGMVRPLVPVATPEPVELGTVAALREGQPLLAISGGDDGDVTTVSVASRRSFSGSWEYHIDTALYTSPPVNAAGLNHSGAGLFDERGRLVGIGSLIVADVTGLGRRSPGNLFVPVDLLRPVLQELTQQGRSVKSRRPWLGVTASEREGRIRVDRLSADGPAQAAGLTPGDWVLAVDGNPVSTLEAFYKSVWARAEPTTEVRLTVLQGAEVKTLTVRPIDRMGSLQRPAGI